MSHPVVLVTGGGRGIGRAVCLRFAREGARIVPVSRTAAELDATREAVVEAGGSCDPRTMDICQPEDLAALIEDVAGSHGRIDVLVNNAGVATLSTIEELEPSVLNTMIAVNILSVYHACRAVWPIMRRQGGGTIINIASVAAVDPFPGLTAYGASKAWVSTWSKGLAGEGQAHNIRVFAVAPGAVETRMLRDAFPTFPTEQALQPADVADVVHALASPDVRYASGQTIFVRK